MCDVLFFITWFEGNTCNKSFNKFFYIALLGMSDIDTWWREGVPSHKVDGCILCTLMTSYCWFSSISICQRLHAELHLSSWITLRGYLQNKWSPRADTSMGQMVTSHCSPRENPTNGYYTCSSTCKNCICYYSQCQRPFHTGDQSAQCVSCVSIAIWTSQDMSRIGLRELVADYHLCPAYPTF